MKVKVLFFAQLREAFGSGECLVDVPPDTTAADALSAPGFPLGDCGNDSYAKVPFSYAVNENFVSPDYVLREGDVLAILTPVSGG